MKRMGWKRILAVVLAALLGLIAALGLAETAMGQRREDAGERITENAGGAPFDAETLQARKKKNKSTPRPTATPAPGAAMTTTPIPEGPIIDPQSIADYLFSHDFELPENFITKREARALGWQSVSYNLSDVAPGMSIGGDYFGNYEEKLPVAEGLEYREADCYYTEGRRGACRIIYSTDGRVWYTEDHYETFTELFPTVPTPTPEP